MKDFSFFGQSFDGYGGYYVPLDEMLLDLTVNELPEKEFYWISYRYGNA